MATSRRDIRFTLNSAPLARRPADRSKCGAPMWMTRIEPDGPSLEKRTFECQACQNEAIEIVKYP
jgi:hypothetical protein